MRYLLKLIFFVFCVLIKSSFAVPEQNYTATLNGQVLPYFSQGDQRTFINTQGLKLSFHSFVESGNKKTIVILPGRTEPALKYAELIYDLKGLGYNIYVLDHQGQGASERLLKDSQKGHVRYFNNYVRDFTSWLDEVVIPETQNQERFLIAHSMGGAVGALYLANGKPTFKKAVLSAPMMELNTKPYKETVARALSGALTLARLGSKYAQDRGPYVVGGPTNRWVHQSLITTKRIDRVAKKVKIPFLLFQSGLDLIVKPGRQNAFCEKSPDCTKLLFSSAHHEILQETDLIRNRALNSIIEFLQ